LEAAIGRVRRNAPGMAVHSAALARLLTAEELCDPAYWTRQVTEPVRFAEAIDGVARGRRVFLEVGPRQSLSTLCRQVLATEKSLAIIPCLGEAASAQAEMSQVMTALGRLWMSGVAPAWEAIQGEG